MKTVTATEARKAWFRLLDEVVEGEVVVIDRAGVRVELRRANRDQGEGWQLPDYGRVLRLTGGDNADDWGWDWDAESGEARPADPGAA